VYLDLNNNAQREPAEPQILTAADGSYSFGNRAPGNYHVRLELAPPLLQTAPTRANTFERREFALGKNPQGAAAADFDGVNGADMAITIADRNLVSILLNDGTGSFSTVQSLTTHNQPGFVAAGDLTGDGWPDLVVSNAYGNDISIFVNQINSSAPFPLTTTLHYATQLKSPAAGVPLGIALGQFNGVGMLDIAVVNSFSEEVAIFLNETVVLPGGQSNPNFRLAQVVEKVGKRPQAIVAGNFTGDLADDTSLDLAVANFGDSTGGHTVRILQNNGAGAFSLFGSPLPVGSGPTSIAAGQLNGDPFPDVVTSDFAANTVTVLWGAAAGVSASATTLAGGFGPSSVVITNIDADSDLDLAVSNGVNATDANRVLLLRNQGGTFAPAEPTGSATFQTNAAFSLIAADFANDGNASLDLAVVNPIRQSGAGNEGGRVAVLKNSVITNTSRQTNITGGDVEGLDFGVKLVAWLNFMVSHDVDNDACITAGDALDAINALNASLFPTNTELPPINNSTPRKFYDVTGDNFLAADDALDVINFLNAFGAQCEAEESSLPELIDEALAELLGEHQ
jgi:hypothetical protein